MTHYRKRCIHCKDEYIFQGSGEGCFEPENDSKYCPQCAIAIYNALSYIDVKYEKEYVETDELTKEEFFKAREKRLENAQLPFVRVLLGRIINGKNGMESDREKIDFEEIGGKEYIYREWENGHEPPKMTVAMQKNIKTGKLEGVWYEYD